MRDDKATVHSALVAKGWPVVLRALNVKTSQGRIACPVHGGKDANCALGTKDGRLVFHCHSHGCSGDALDFVAAVRGVDFLDALEIGAIIGGVVIDVTGSSTHYTTTPLHQQEREREAYAAQHRQPSSEPDRTYPSQSEVAELWKACVQVTAHDRASAYLRSRSLPLAVVDALGLARAIPPTAELPRWARFAGRSWVESCHELVVPFVDATGAMRTLRATDVTGTSHVKRVSPAGHLAKGLVMAERNALALLRGEPARVERVRVAIVEGEIDFLTRATSYTDPETAPAVFGVIAGAWSTDIAARIPDGALVAIRTDHDAAGDKYAEEIRSTLAQRCELRRSRA